MGLNTLLALDPAIYLGDQEFTREEVKNIISQTQGLAFLKGKWVEIDPEKLQSLLQAFDKVRGKNISFTEAIRIQAGLSPLMEMGEDVAEVTNGEWLKTLRVQMANPTKITKQCVRGSFCAQLRDYQNAGFNWLYFMMQLHLGALLADDMGLGKTVQILALLDFLRKDKIKTLLVIPASLIANWQKEAVRFAPKLKVIVLHGKQTSCENCDADLFITTYGMVTRLDKLASITWDLLILDEAQAIWSLFDFLNRGLLGTQKEFTSFAQELRSSTAGYGKLRKTVSPFILRRLKTDKTII